MMAQSKELIAWFLFLLFLHESNIGNRRHYGHNKDLYWTIPKALTIYHDRYQGE